MRKVIGNTRLSGGKVRPYVKNEPAQYGDKRHEYFATPTEIFREEYLKYASDFVGAEMQMWPEGETEAVWAPVELRFANVVRPTAAIQRNFDDYKQILPRDPRIGYIRPGTLVRSMGNVWLVVNPDNMSGGEGAAIVRRCNAVWNHLDWYGNLVSEPIVVENVRANASSPDAQVDQQIAMGYYNVTCQYNDFTRQVNDNTRIILGDAGNPYENAKAYRVTGFGNFFREFTMEAGSVRTLSFTIRVQTKNSDTDDLVNCVADGKRFRWETLLTGPAQAGTGEAVQYFASSLRNGEAVNGTEEHPVSYIWTVEGAQGASISQDGVLTATEAGDVTVTAYLAQNPAQKASMTVTVSGQENGVRFVSAVSPSLGALDSVVVQAAVFANGTRTEDTVTWSWSGGEPGAFTVGTEGNEALIHCYGYAKAPLVLTASFGAYSARAEIRLEGL